jgi:hypothetical protein
MARNPYDRRDIPRGRNNLPAMVADGSYYSNPFNAMNPGISHGGIEIADLQAMVVSAAARGERRAVDDLQQRHAEEIGVAQRAAWEQGEASGQQEGRDQLLGAIDRQFGDRAKQTSERTYEAHANQKITKADLRAALLEAGNLIYELIQAHHAGFQGES